MKKSNAFITVMIILMIIVGSKPAIAQKTDNYYVIADSLDAYFNAHPDLKQKDDGEYAQFIRWKEFWRNRVYGQDSNARGSFTLFRKAVKDYLDKKDYYNRSTIIGSDWHCLGPDHITEPKRGLISCLYVDTAADKNMNTIYIGTNASGIWKTIDGGFNWHNVTDPTGIPLLGISDITGDPNNGNVIYAATSFFVTDLLHSGGIGIIKSIDGGVTWTQLLPFDPSDNKTVYRILIDPYNSQRIYVLIDSLLLRNTNSGIGTWDTLFKCPSVPGWEHRKLRDLVMKPGDNTTLYVASDCRYPDAQSHNLAKAFIIRNVTNANLNTVYAVSLDSLFTPIGDTIFTQRYQIAVTPADTSAIYIGCQQIIPKTGNSYQFRFKLWKYDNINSWKLRINVDEDSLIYPDICAGVSWDKISILVSPSDTSVVYVGGLFWDKFVHGQRSLSNSKNIHVDVRCGKILQITPSDTGRNDIIFTGNDGGISKTIDGTGHWQNINGNGLVITEFWGIGDANKIPNRIYAGSQDNSFFRYDYGTWILKGTGDNGKPAVDYLTPDTLFVPVWVGGGVARSKNGGVNWGETQPNPYYCFDTAEIHLPNFPIRINPKNHKEVYIGYHNLWKSTQYGDYGSYKKINIPLVNPPYASSDGISTFCISPLDTNIIYVAYAGPIIYWTGYQTSKFFRSNDGGLSWIDLTSNINTTLHPLLNYYGITAIEASPTDSNSVWITFGGYLSTPDSTRVLLSINNGDTWNFDSHYSLGLPNTPINCIKYMNGSNGRLFVGTDEGVFYRDNTCSEWQPFNSGLPVCIVTDLEINDNVQKIRAATFGRGLYETDLTCNFSSTPWRINHNINILNDTAVDQSIIIDSTYTLTVKAKLKFPPQGKIIVRPGAKLIVDGGTLTNRCNNMWGGVEVKGNNRLKQNTINQGYVNLKNGAIVENARIGISTNGGLIMAQNSFFRNNYNAIKFETYSYDQLSTFTKVIFETTRNYLDTNYSVPQDFVSLWGVKGVRFLGCTFQNTTVPVNSIPGLIKGRGIYSIDATFYVDQYSYCSGQVVPCPNPVITPSTFKGLYYGIRVYNTDPAKYIEIKKSIFDHNYRGVYLGSSNYSTIIQNKFFIPNHTQPGADTCYGLYLGTCSGYQVEDNQFTAPGNVLVQPGYSFHLRDIGLIVDNSGGSPNEIYRNHFDTLDIAINGQRINRQDGGAITLGPIGGGGPVPVSVPTGLVLKCNTYNNNSYDEMATKGYISALEGIAKNQGASTIYGKDQAGNMFSPYHLQAQFPESDVKNVADNVIYYHQIQDNSSGAPRVLPNYHTPEPKVHPQSVQNQYIYNESCPSKLPSLNPIVEDFTSTISREGAIVNSLLSQLKNLVDGGKTDEKNSSINNSTPNDALVITQDLLNYSPYLSDTVMKSAIAKESVLPNEMIRDILVANPQAAKTEEVLSTLNDRFIPMPDSLMADILDGKDQLSPKEELEAQIALHAQYFKDAYNGLVRYYLTDSIASANPDSIINFLESISDLDGKYLLASEYIASGDTSKMNNTLRSISNTFTLDKTQQVQYQDYKTYFSFLKSLLAQGKDILQIDSSQIIQLRTLSATLSEPVASYIRNILISNNQINYFEPIIIPDNSKSAPETNKIKTGHFSKTCSLKVYPNPAKGYLIAEYNTRNLSLGNNEILLTITSSDGKIVETILLSKPQDQKLIETSDYKPGFYLCSLKTGNKIVASCKFTIIQ